MNTQLRKSLIALGITLGICFIGFIYLTLSYFYKWYPFQPYKRAPVPPGMFEPTGKIRNLTEDELKIRQKLLECLQRVGINDFDQKCLPVVQEE